jgi:TolA-binding protein
VTLGRLGQVSEACLTLREVGAQFPDAPELIDQAEAEADSLACG